MSKKQLHSARQPRPNGANAVGVRLKARTVYFMLVHAVNFVGDGHSSPNYTLNTFESRRFEAYWYRRQHHPPASKRRQPAHKYQPQHNNTMKPVPDNVKEILTQLSGPQQVTLRSYIATLRSEIKQLEEDALNAKDSDPHAHYHGVFCLLGTNG